jgi:hypothetical protein
VATIQVTIPDGAQTRILDAVCSTYGFDPASGLTKAQFARDHLRQHLKDVTRAYEAAQAAETARTAKLAEVETLIG